MYQFKRNEGTNTAKSKKKSEQNLRRVVLKSSILTNGKKIIHFQENPRNQCVVVPRAAAVDTATATPGPSTSSLVVNKWKMPVTNQQIVPAMQTPNNNSKLTGGPMFKNININGRIIPMKVLEIIPANKQHNSIQASSSGNAREFVTQNGAANLDEQTDLREQVKRLNEQNAQILTRINRSKSFSTRLREMKDVDEFEEKIDTNSKKQYLANYLRKRIKNKSNTIMEIIELLFTEELVSKFNTNGLRKKRSFKKLHLNSVIRVLSGLEEKSYYLELARCIHTITARHRRQQIKNP